ncbi:MAG: hypothetical protein M3Q51_01655 [Pseudomonadota bacterium]|nr:hypothetical protein [Pseudomonadota bacterium]
MKTLLLPLITGALVLGTGISCAAGPVLVAAPLRPIGECLVTNQVLDWGVVDQRRLVVKTLGSRYYDIQLSHRCRDLNRRPYLSFRDGLQSMPLGSGRGFSPGTGSAAVTTDGRICGDLGDAVVPRSGFQTGLDLPCDIARIRRIDRRAFNDVSGMDARAANAMLDASPSVIRLRSKR